MDRLEPESKQVTQNRETCLEFCIQLMQAVFDKEIEKRVLIGTYATSEHKPIVVDILQHVDRAGILEGVYSKESENYETIWNVKSCVNILLTWLVKYFMEDKHVSSSSFAKE